MADGEVHVTHAAFPTRGLTLALIGPAGDRLAQWRYHPDGYWVSDAGFKNDLDQALDDLKGVLRRTSTDVR